MNEPHLRETAALELVLHIPWQVVTVTVDGRLVEE